MTEAEQYELILKAALNVTRSKFALAEALVLDIPMKEEGDGQRITDALEEVAAQIVDMGGDEIAPKTLAGYREAAKWVESPSGGEFRWRKGSSFTAHRRAAQGGMDYDEFAKLPRTTRDVQKMLGQKASALNVETKVEEMTSTERVDMARALAAVDHDAVLDAAVEKQKEKIERKVAPPTTVHKEPTRSDVFTQRRYALSEEIGSTVKYSEIITSRWRRELDEISSVVAATHLESMIEDAESIVAVYEKFILDLKVSV